MLVTMKKQDYFGSGQKQTAFLMVLIQTQCIIKVCYGILYQDTELNSNVARAAFSFIKKQQQVNMIYSVIIR